VPEVVSAEEALADVVALAEVVSVDALEEALVAEVATRATCTAITRAKMLLPAAAVEAEWAADSAAGLLAVVALAALVEVALAVLWVVVGRLSVLRSNLASRSLSKT